VQIDTQQLRTRSGPHRVSPGRGGLPAHRNKWRAVRGSSLARSGLAWGGYFTSGFESGYLQDNNPVLSSIVDVKNNLF